MTTTKLTVRAIRQHRTSANQCGIIAVGGDLQSILGPRLRRLFAYIIEDITFLLGEIGKGEGTLGKKERECFYGLDFVVGDELDFAAHSRAG